MIVTPHSRVTPKAGQLYEHVGDKLGQANVYLAIARIKDDDALYLKAIEAHSAVKGIYSVATDKYYFGISLIKRHDIPRGRVLLQEARIRFESIHFEPGVSAVDAQLEQLND